MSMRLGRTLLLRWTIRPIAYLVMQFARLGLWMSERLVRGSLLLGAGPAPLERLPPYQRERLLKGYEKEASRDRLRSSRAEDQ